MAQVKFERTEDKFQFTFTMDSKENRALSAAVAVFMSAPDHVAQHILNDADADIESYKESLDGIATAVVAEVSRFVRENDMTVGEIQEAILADMNR